MTHWNEIKCGFDLSEETSVFGTRAFCSTDELQIYEANTVATLASSNSNSNPKPITFLSEKMFVIAVDCTFAVFVSEFSELHFSTSLREEVNALAVASQEDFIFIGLKTSELLCFSVQSKRLFTISKSLDDINANQIHDTYFAGITAVSSHEEVKLLVMDCTGRISSYCFGISKLHALLDEQNSTEELLMSYFENDLTRDVLAPSKPLKSLPQLSNISNYENSFIISNEGGASFLSLTGNMSSLFTNDDVQHTIIKVIFSPCSVFVLFLLDSGALLILSVLTKKLLGFWQCKSKIIDFFFIKKQGKNSTSDGSDIILLTEEESPAITLMTFPAFEKILSYKVKYPCYLVNSAMLNGDIHYMESHGDSETSMLHIKLLVEASPNLRLQRLLQRGKFEEAEDFAKNFNLKMEKVYQSKALKIARDLSPWICNLSDEESHKLFEELIILLHKTEDTDFLTRLPIEYDLCNLAWTEEILVYALSKIKSQPEGEADIAMIDKVAGLTSRLRVFRRLYAPAEATMWPAFSTSNLLTECQALLSRGELKRAAGLAASLPDDLTSGLNEETTKNLLLLLFNCPVMDDLLYFLRAFLPLLLSKLSNAIHLIEGWVLDKARSMEREGKSPDACLELLERLLEILKPSWTLVRAPLTSLSTLVSDLRTCLHLLTKYHLRVPHQLIQQTYPEELIQFLLDNVPTDCVASLVKEFIYQHCCHHSLDFDTVISKYIQRCVMRELSWSGNEGHYFESRCLIIVRNICSFQKKIETLLMICEEAIVPWSTELNDLVNGFLQDMDLMHNLPQHYAENLVLAKNQAVKKLILKKYGFGGDFSLYSNTYIILNYIFKDGRDTMLSDAKTYSSTSSGDKMLYYCTYFSFCLNNKRDVMEAFHLIDSELEPKEKQRCYNRMTYYITERERISNNYRESYSSSLLDTVRSHISSQCRRNEIALQHSKLAANAQKILGIEVEPATFASKHRRKDLLREYCINLLKYCDENTNGLVFIQKLREEVNAVGLARLDVLFELALLFTNDGFFSLSAICLREILEMESGFMDYHLEVYQLCVAVLKGLNPAIPQHEIIEPLKNIMSKSFSSLPVCFLMKFTELRNLLDIFDDSDVQSQILPNSSRGPHHINKDFLDFLVEVVIGDNESARDCVPFKESNIFKFFTQTQSFTVASKIYRLLSTYGIFQNKSNLKTVYGLLLKCLSDTLLKLVTSKKFNFELALGLLHHFETENAIKWLKNVSQSTIDTNMLYNINVLGKSYCALHSKQITPTNGLFFSRDLVSITWIRRLKRFGITGTTREDYEDDERKRSLLIRFISASNVDFLTLKKFCQDLNIDEDEWLQLYSQQLLLTWKPVFTFNKETRELDFKSSQKALLEQMRNVVMKVNDRSAYVKFLRFAVWSKVNHYYYEVFSVILQIMQSLGAQIPMEMFSNRLLLNFLHNYVRISSPREFEIGDLSHDGTFSLPPIAKYRLPFRPLPDHLWTLIKPEMSLMTYKMWMSVPSWFGQQIERDSVCLFAIYNLKPEEPQRRAEECPTWNMHSQKKDLMLKIEECVSHITSQEKATAALYFVINNIMPPGLDQVEAAQKCLLSCIEWNNTEKSPASRMGLEKTTRKNYSISITHFLYKFELASPEYLALVLEPRELIVALYHHPNIIESVLNPLIEPLKINEAVDCISSVQATSLKLMNLKLELLFQWLSLDSCTTDNSFFLDSRDSSLPLTDSKQNSIDENMLRVKYLLQYGDVNNSCSLLVGLVFVRGQLDSSHPVQFQLRALKCLLSILGPDQIRNCTGHDLSYLRRLAESLELVCDLESVGLEYSVASLETCAKEPLVTELIRLNSLPSANIAARLATSFSIRNPQLWTSILSTMTRLGMEEGLEKYLREVQCFSHRLDSKVFKAAWQRLLELKLCKADKCNKDFEDNCLLLLDSCPIITEMDLNELQFNVTIQAIKDKLNSLC